MTSANLSRGLGAIVQSREFTEVVNKNARDWTQRPVLQRQNCDRPWSRRQLDVEHLHSEGMGIIARKRSWKRRDIAAGSDHAGANMRRKGAQDDPWHRYGARLTGLGNDLVIPARGRGQYPRFIDELREVDPLLASPPVIPACDDDQLILKQYFHTQLIERRIVRLRAPAQSLE